MLKRLFCIVLCLVTFGAMLSGCTLFETDTEADFKREVAVIQKRDFYDGDTVYYTSDRKGITKYALMQYFNNNAQSIMQEQGLTTIEEVLQVCLDNLINRELLLDEAYRLIEAGELKKPTQKQINDLWKAAYQQIDTEIYTQMDTIAESFGDDLPVRPQTGTNPEPQYPIKTVETNELEVDEPEWKPDENTWPQKGVEGDRESYLHLEGVRSFMNYVISVLELQEYLLNDADKARLQADKERWDALKKKPSNDLYDVYVSLPEYFCIEYFFYRSSYESQLINNFEIMIKDQVVVTNEDVVKLYNEEIAAQSQITQEDYTTALDDASKVVLAHPYNVQQYYVKHILIPFSDAQKELFAATGKYPDSYLKTIRNNLAGSITSYEHRDGYDYIEGGLKSAVAIEQEIYAAMANKAGFQLEAEQTFEHFIFKYNTDPGIFNNVKGYGMRYGEASSYMKEFEDGAVELYERYLEEEKKGGARNAAIGSLTTVITDYGIHIMMLSDVVKPRNLALSDFTTVFQTQTVFEMLKKQVEETKKNEAYQNYQSGIINILNKQRADDITINQKIVDEIIKSAT